MLTDKVKLVAGTSSARGYYYYVTMVERYLWICRQKWCKVIRICPCKEPEGKYLRTDSYAMLYHIIAKSAFFAFYVITVIKLEMQSALNSRLM